MNKFFGIIILHLTSFTLYSQNNSFLPIIKHNAEWYSVQGYCCAPASYHRLRFDTTIVKLNNVDYKNVVFVNDSVGLSSNRSSIFCRESNGMFWVWDTLGYDEEELVMNMNVETGDTFIRNSEIYGQKRFIVSSIGYVSFSDNVSRKICNLRCPDNELYLWRWIEGVGDESNILGQDINCVVDQGGKQLRCYFENGTQLITSEDGKPCWVTTATSAPAIKDLIISPNPASVYFDIELSDGMQLPLQYEIITIAGQRVENGSHNTSDQVHIDTDNLQAGLYIIKLRDKRGKVWQGKVVVE